MSYALQILPRAEKQLSRLNSPHYESVKARVSGLREQPRPAGSRKLRGHEAWRIRAGDYRVIYTIDDSTKLVTVVKIGHRSEAYENLHF
ncbi:MAG: type II toxin-antitoxin system RelE family toxin [Candidatus Acidiferrales bacterium]